MAEDVIARAVADRPAAAGVAAETLDDVARHSIAFETKKSATMAFAAGLPGGFALVGTVPADIAQYYVHAFRVMQKLAYLYGCSRSSTTASRWTMRRWVNWARSWV